MAQHDMAIADQAGLAFLADLNNALSALVSNNSGATEPAATFAYQWWADTGSGWLKQRNAANDAWINKIPLANAMSVVGSALFSADSTAAARTALGLAIGSDVQAYNQVLAGIASGTTPLEFGNDVINGGFDIWQRGTTGLLGTGAEVFGPDRWLAFQNTASVAWARSLFSPGQTVVPGNPEFYASLTLNSGGSGAYVGQKLEDVARRSGKSITISFWMKGNAARTCNLVIVQNFGSGGSTSVATTVSSLTIPNGTWTYVEAEISVPSVAGKTIGAGNYLLISLQTFSAVGFVLDLANFSSVEGSEPRPFYRQPYSVELSRCQRFNPAKVAQSVTDSIGTGNAISATQAIITVPHSVAARAASTGISVSSAAHFSVTDEVTPIACTAVVFSSGGSLATKILITVAGGLTAGKAYSLYFNNAAGTLNMIGCEL